MGVVTTLKSEHTYVIQLLSLNSVSINEKVNGYEWMLPSHMTNMIQLNMCYPDTAGPCQTVCELE